ncbi:MAG: CRISPR-associated endonuclease Cas1 [Enterobacteriaceae bacterium]
MKKLRNTLYITRDGAYLHKERETLLVEQTIEGKRNKLLQTPIHSVGGIFCFGNIMISPQLMGFCGENGTHLAFYDGFGRFQARVVGRQTGNVLLRRAQFRRADGGDSQIARNIVAAKISSSRTILQRYQRTYGENTTLSAAIKRLRQIVTELQTQTVLERIRGFEGEAASHYFAVFDQLITHM